jgi:hypothetical protein
MLKVKPRAADGGRLSVATTQARHGSEPATILRGTKFQEQELGALENYKRVARGLTAVHHSRIIDYWRQPSDCASMAQR